MNSEDEELIADAKALVESWDHRGSWSPDSPVGMVARLAARLEASAVSSPSEDIDGILDRATLEEYMRVDPDETYERLVVKANALASTVKHLLAAVSSPPTITDDVALRFVDTLGKDGEYVARQGDDFIIDGRWSVADVLAALAAALHPGGETNG